MGAGPLYSTFAATLAVNAVPRNSGRFAPTPSGPLHQGSLVAALGSYLAARSRGGRWQIRIDDIDRNRVVRGADTQILSALEAHGLTWDGPVVYQSTRIEAYRDALDALIRNGHAYRCTCTRRAIAATASMGTAGPIYPGTCRSGSPTDKSPNAWRADMRGPSLTFGDLALGQVNTNPETACGDIVIWRADDLPSYHLACAIDEAHLGVNEVVRGLDLLNATACQIRLSHLMDIAEPVYGHLPLVLGPDGQKLAKRHGADGLLPHDAATNIRRALHVLGMTPPPELASTTAMRDWATRHFTWRAVQRQFNDRVGTPHFFAG